MAEEIVRCVYCGKILKDKASIKRKCGLGCYKKNKPKKKELLRGDKNGK